MSIMKIFTGDTEVQTTAHVLTSYIPLVVKAPLGVQI